MRIVTGAFTAIAMTVLAGAEPAPAQEPSAYAWCAQYSGRGITNCGFRSLQQCQWTISGEGGHCVRNPVYAGERRPAPDRRRRDPYQ